MVRLAAVVSLFSAGKLRALGRPRPNAVKFFSAIELITVLADPDWLDEATRTIGQFWKRNMPSAMVLPWKIEWTGIR